MKKFTKKELSELLKDVENNFSALVDALIYFESIDKDEYSWNILHKIESLHSTKEVKLIIVDLPNRKGIDSLLYNSLWYGLANQEETKPDLIEGVRSAENINDVLAFLSTLNEGGGRKGELNIQSVIDEVNAGMKKPKP